MNCPRCLSWRVKEKIIPTKRPHFVKIIYECEECGIKFEVYETE